MKKIVLKTVLPNSFLCAEKLPQYFYAKFNQIIIFLTKRLWCFLFYSDMYVILSILLYSQVYEVIHVSDNRTL